MANFRVVSQSGAAASHTAAILKSIADRNMVQIQMMKLQQDDKFKQQAANNDRLLTVAQVRASEAKTKDDKANTEIARKSAESRIMMSLMASIGDTMHNGLRKGEITREQHSAIQRGAGMTVNGIKAMGKKLGLRDDLVNTFTANYQQSGQIVDQRAQMADEFRRSEPQKYGWLRNSLLQNGVSKDKLDDTIAGMPQKQRQELFDQATQSMELKKTQFTDQLAMIKMKAGDISFNKLPMEEKMAMMAMETEAKNGLSKVSQQMSIVGGFSDQKKKMDAVIADPRLVEARRTQSFGPEDFVRESEAKRLADEAISGAAATTPQVTPPPVDVPPVVNAAISGAPPPTQRGNNRSMIGGLSKIGSGFADFGRGLWDRRDTEFFDHAPLK